MRVFLFTLELVAFLSVSCQAKPFPDLGFRHQLDTRQSTLASCLGAKNVPTSYTSSADWSSLVTPYNLRLSYTPAAISLPMTAQHVSDSVVCASAAGVKVQAKSGGHSYASYSSGGQDGSLIIDLQEFNTISVDSATGVATVGGGVRLGNLALGIYNQGQRALPHGTCPGVGIGGHFTHGGYGYDSRAWGLALDTIVAMDVVLANGSFVHTTATSYPQIFFALRGAADSFGVVTTFYLQTLPAPTAVINFSVSLPAVLNSASIAANAFLKLQTFVRTSTLMNRNLTFGIYTDGSGFSLSGWYFGNQAYFTSTVLPTMLNGFPAAESTNIKAMSWLDSLVNEAGEPLAQPLSGYSAHDTFYAKSITTRDSIPLTLAALKSFFAYVINQGRSASDPWFSIINLYGGLDSQINSKPVSSSAYSDRDSLWVFQNYGYTANDQPPYDAAITTFIDGLTTALTSAQPDGKFGAYLNYVDPSLSAQQAADQYYGATLYSQLASIKGDVDPNSVFWNPQAIIPAKKASSTSSSKTASKTSTTSVPASTLKVSTDATCGGTSGNTCLGSSFGNCCSTNGWCGSTTAYCGTGCQSAFGSCTVTVGNGSPSPSTSSINQSSLSSSTPPKPSSFSTTLTKSSSTTKPPTSSTTSPASTSTLKASTDGSCGKVTGSHALEAV